MATRHATAQQWHRTTGCIVQQGYGLSETSPVITLSQHQYAFDTHVGTAIPMTQSHNQSTGKLAKRETLVKS